MLMRILTDNPGPTFTRNIDARFVDTVKDLLRNGRDTSVRHMLMETLDSFENQKGWDEGLEPLIELWRKEKEKAYKAYGVRPSLYSGLRERLLTPLQGRPPPPQQPRAAVNAPTSDPHSQNYFARSHSNKRLPYPVELANRLEEARTSSNLLTQLVANTPSTEVLDNDLIKEFADRCLSASRSIQGYMTAENPSPDNETMESLIDVNEELQQALNNQKRAMLSARKELGLGDRSQDPSPQPPEVNGLSRPPMPAPASSSSGAAAPMAWQPVDKGKGKGKGRQEFDDEYVQPPRGPPPSHSAAGPNRSANITPLSADEGQNPFLDPELAASSSSSGKGKAAASRGASALEEPMFAQEPFHPGFKRPTESYLGRQDSAMNKLTMHGADYASSGYQDETAGSNYHSSCATAGGSSLASNADDVSELDDDIYGAPPSTSYGRSSSGERPVYRY